MFFPVELGHTARVVLSLLSCSITSRATSTAVADSVAIFREQFTHNAATDTRRARAVLEISYSPASSTKAFPEVGVTTVQMSLSL